MLDFVLNLIMVVWTAVALLLMHSFYKNAVKQEKTKKRQRIGFLSFDRERPV